VQETGEVYLFKHGHPLDGGGTVSLLDRRFGLGELQRALSGYRDVVGRSGSLVWFLERVAQPGPATTTRVGAASTVVEPYRCAIVAGNADASAAGAAPPSVAVGAL
jgi:hypothetical protein